MKPEVSLLASTTLSLEQEKNPWLAAEARFDEAATRLNLDDGQRKALRTSAKEITVHIPVQLDDGRLDDVEMRRRQHPFRRRQGRRHLRSQHPLPQRTGKTHAPLHLRDHGISRPPSATSGRIRLPVYVGDPRAGCAFRVRVAASRK